MEFPVWSGQKILRAHLKFTRLNWIYSCELYNCSKMPFDIYSVSEIWLKSIERSRFFIYLLISFLLRWLPTYKFIFYLSVWIRCIHCKNFQGFDINQIIEHCKTCKFIERADPFRSKYACCVCTRFSTYHSGNMRNHINKHMGEKPISCKYCEYKGVQKSHLTKHLLRFHNVS